MTGDRLSARFAACKAQQRAALITFVTAGDPTVADAPAILDALVAGDLAVFRTAGAYGATMASSYNSRGFVAEVMVDGDKFAVVADRIVPEAISAAERVPEWLD